MEHIVYIHINNDKILPNLGLSFDPQYEVKAEMQPLRDYEFHRTYFSLNITKAKGFGRTQFLHSGWCSGASRRIIDS